MTDPATHRTEIDGLRAIAVLSVMLYHADFQLFSGGFIGVDVFFVISGYLISGLIVKDLQRGQFTFRNFYERRARRILPALFVVLLFCLPFALHLASPKELQSFFVSLITVPLFLANVGFMRQFNYFDATSETSPLLHTWSLSVEEQYYLVFPIAIALIYRWKRPWLFTLLVCTAVGGFCVAQVWLRYNPLAAFYLALPRAWEFLFGALLAYYEVTTPKQLPRLANDSLLRGDYFKNVAGVVGIALIFIGLILFDKNTPDPGYHALIPVVGTIIVLRFGLSSTLVGRALSYPPLRLLGLISYSAYLWHQPLMAFARMRSVYEPPQATEMLTLIGVSFVIAYVSWRYIENPCRNAALISTKTLFTALGLTTLVFLCIGLEGTRAEGSHTATLLRPKTVSVSPQYQFATIENGWCFYSVDSMITLKVGQAGLNCRLGTKNASTRGLLFGDSFAGQYDPLWDVLGKKDNFEINSIATNWCYPAVGNDFPGPRSSRAYEQCLSNRKYVIDELKNYDFVVIGGDWGSAQARGVMGFAYDFIDRVIESGKFLVVMPSPKIYDTDVGQAYLKALFLGVNFDITKLTNHKDKNYIVANESLQQYLKKYGDQAIFLDRSMLFGSPDAQNALAENGVPISFDGRHVSIAGANHAANQLLKNSAYGRLLEQLKKQ